ncbi:MAG: tryptophan halogenase family protein [Wenzhouxiangella sp.]
MAPELRPERIEKVLIVGGGTAGWMAAAVLARAFGPQLEIRLVESEQIGIVGVGEATIPQIRLINHFLGLDENEFLRAARGSFKLGIQFNGWTAPRHSYIHAFGEIGRPLELIGFHQYWFRAQREKLGLDLWSYSINATAAFENCFDRLDAANPLPPIGFNYAFHFDASLYAAHLRGYAEKRGVKRVEGRVVDVDLDGESGFVRGVQTERGDRLEADFFMDCSGFRGLLIEQAMKTGYEDWTHFLPCDRAVAVPSARVAPMRPYTQADARPAGWQWRIPLQHRTGNGYVYCSRFVSDDEAVANLLTNLDGEALDEPRLIRFVTGRRRKFWNRNCVALGLASGFMEPLESTSIHLVQSAISRLVKHFPTRGFDPTLIEEYNRQSIFEFESIRDFLIFHYHQNGRHGDPFWDERRAIELPESLLHRIKLFRASGEVFRNSEELFTEQSWLQVLLGQGVVPERHHPLADRLSAAELAQFLCNLRKVVKTSLRSMPDHADFIARHCLA